MLPFESLTRPPLLHTLTWQKTGTREGEVDDSNRHSAKFFSALNNLTLTHLSLFWVYLNRFPAFPPARCVPGIALVIPCDDLSAVGALQSKRSTPTLCCLDLSLALWIIHRLRNKVRIWSQMTRRLFSQHVQPFFFFFFNVYCRHKGCPRRHTQHLFLSDRKFSSAALPAANSPWKDQDSQGSSASRGRCTTRCTSVESQGDMFSLSTFLLFPRLLEHKESEEGPKESRCQLSFPLCTFF